jgi:hypothetical protein
VLSPPHGQPISPQPQPLVQMNFSRFAQQHVLQMLLCGPLSLSTRPMTISDQHQSPFLAFHRRGTHVRIQPEPVLQRHTPKVPF